MVWGAAILLGIGALLFGRRQNAEGKMGGRMSWPKQLWLGWAVYVWFVLCPAVAALSTAPLEARRVLGAFAAWMWLRGAVELYMLYVSKNWRPPMGFAHNLSAIALVLGMSAAHREAWWGASVGRWSWALVLMVLFSLVLETGFAVAFHRAVDGRTTGDDAVWFADAKDPKFARINRVTAIFLVPLYGFLLGFLIFAVSS